MILVAFDTKASTYVNWNPYVSAKNFDFDGAGGQSVSGIIGEAEILSEKDFESRVVGSVWCYA